MGEFMSSSLEIILFETPAVVSTLKNHGDTHSVPKEKKTPLHLGVCIYVRVHMRQRVKITSQMSRSREKRLAFSPLDHDVHS